MHLHVGRGVKLDTEKYFFCAYSATLINHT